MSSYNQTPYAKRSMHSEFDSRQSEITLGAGQNRGYRTTQGSGVHSRGRGRGRARGRRGYGYVGNSKKLTPSYKKDSEINPSSTQFQTPRCNSTRQKYRLKETIEDPIEPNMIEIKGNESVQQYVDSALDLFSKENRIIYVIATGRAINKAINCVEIIKRKQYGLHQESYIENNIIHEIWEPLEEYLKTVIVEREMIYVKIILTFEKRLVNQNNIGYQQPISWIDLGDAREFHNAMKGKIGKLQNEYDIQSKDLNDSRVSYGKLQHKYDEQEHIMNKQMTEYTDIMGKFTELKAQYDIQELNDSQLVKDKLKNKTKYNLLQEKYDKLQKHNDDREEQLRVKQNKFDDLNVNESVDVIIEQNQERYTKYKDTLLKNFIEQEIDGSCLNQLTKDDLYSFGIRNYKDRITIFKAIKTLFI